MKPEAFTDLAANAISTHRFRAYALRYRHAQSRLAGVSINISVVDSKLLVGDDPTLIENRFELIS